MKRNLSVLFACSLCATSLASAETTPESTAAAKEMVRVMKLSETIKRIQGSMGDIVDAISERRGLTPEQAAKVKVDVREVLPSLVSKIDFEGIVAETYAEQLSVEDMKAIAEFYRSPAGQRYADKQMELGVSMTKRMQAAVVKLMPEIERAVDKAIEDRKRAAVKPGE